MEHDDMQAEAPAATVAEDASGFTLRNEEELLLMYVPTPEEEAATRARWDRVMTRLRVPKVDYTKDTGGLVVLQPTSDRACAYSLLDILSGIINLAEEVIAAADEE